MIKPKIFDEISQKVMEKLPKGMHEAKAGMEKNIKSALQAVLGKLDLVTREEFDAQAAVLKRCQEQLKALEKHLEDLEKSQAKK